MHQKDYYCADYLNISGCWLGPTHSPQFLDAFKDVNPTTTVAKWENGETILTTLSDEKLGYWLKEYSLGTLFRSGELEQMQ